MKSEKAVQSAGAGEEENRCEEARGGGRSGWRADECRRS